jgi:signal peptidase
MEPVLKVGSVAVVGTQDDYEVGDVITFRLQNGSKSTVTHRIQEVLSDGGEVKYVTKGDANEDPDLQPVEKSRVLGEVVWTVPLIGKIFEYMKTQQGFIFLIVIPATIFAYHEAQSIWGEIKSKIKELKTKGKKNRESRIENRATYEIEHEIKIRPKTEDTRHNYFVQKKKMKVIGKDKDGELKTED